MADLCDTCWYNIFDDDSQEYFCDLTLDEDEYAKILESSGKTCKYYRPDSGEYDIVRKQN